MRAGNSLPSLSGERVAVLGGGVSGTSLALLAAKRGADVFVSDAKGLSGETAVLLENAGILYEQWGHTDKILDCDRVILSSGFPPYVDIIRKITERGIPLTGELDFAAPCLSGRLIGVTGSNGKTTTTSLLGHILSFLNPAGTVATAGNIGNAIADLAGSNYDFIAAELSSFQLHWANNTALDGAVVTNLAPDHIDWHGSYENYIAAKAKILSFVRGHEENGGQLDSLPGGFSIARASELGLLCAPKKRVFALEWDVPESREKIVLSSKDLAAYAFGGKLFDFDDTAMIGNHNMENTAMAMAAICLLGFGADRARKALEKYVPPPHRCSLVLELDGARYIDDSKGTNVAATVTALSSIPGRKLVILGGRGKGEDYRALVDPLKRFAKRAFLIGEAAEEIALILRKGGFMDFSATSGMEEAVSMARAAAEPGDVVLLSPACTSWDAYKNYGERGDHFASIARKMARAGNEKL
jgi:UDP-N-acetylmuramoylalanine--D-glutamate ligase